MKILLANPFGIGDVLFSLPMGYALRDAFPQASLQYLCNRRTEEIVRRWPIIDRVFVFEKDEFKERWRRSRGEGLSFLGSVLAPIRREGFDLLMDLSLGWQYSFLGWWVGIPRRIGFDFRRRGRFLTDRLPLEGFDAQPVWRYYTDLLWLLQIPAPRRPELSLPLTADDQAAAQGRLRELGIPEEAQRIGLVPGGGISWGPMASFKQWPVERFAELAGNLLDRSGTQLLLFGDSRERPLCLQLQQALPAGRAWVMETPSLALLAALLRSCRLVIGNDSGPMHLAEAVGTPTVSLFGPVDASVYGPLVSDRHRVVARSLACRPCYRNFRFPPCPWDNACLKGLSVEEVLHAVHEILS